MKTEVKLFPLRPGAAAVAAVFAAVPQAYALEVVCENPTGCHYEQHSNSEWSVSAPGSGKAKAFNADAPLQIKLAAKPYQNEVADSSGLELKDDYVNQESSALIKVSGRAQLTVPSGSSLTLHKAKDDAEAVAVNQADAVLESNVTITVKPSYGEAENLPHPRGEGAFWQSGTAVTASGGANVQTSADIVLDGQGAFALSAHNNGTIRASNHSIRINWPYSIALQTHDLGRIDADNVNITSSADWVMGVEMSDDVDRSTSVLEQPNTVNLNNSHIHLSGKHNAGLLMPGGKVNLTDSSVQAETALALFYPKQADSEYFSDVTVNLDNSTLSGSELLQINPPALFEKMRQQYPDQPRPFNATLTADRGSTLQGRIRTDVELREAGGSFGRYNLNLSGDSRWQMTGSSDLDRLHLQDSAVEFVPQNGFQTLTVHGDLSGNGTFSLNTDLAAGQGDKLMVHGKASGSHVLKVRNTPNEPKLPENAKLTVVETGSSDAGAFRLHNGTVSAGKYLYELTPQNGGKDWALTFASDQTPPNNGSVPTAPDNGGNVSAPSDHNISLPPPPPVAQHSKVLSVFANNRVAQLQAAAHTLDQQQDTLNLRLAELHNPSHLNGLWLQNEGSVLHRGREAITVGADGVSAGFRQNTRGFQIGYDHTLPSGAYVGALAGRSFSDIRHNRAGFADSRLYASTFALYGGFTRNGWFADGVLRHSRYRSRHPEESSNRFHINSISMQTGAQLPVGGGWSVVPQAALTLGRVSRSAHTAGHTLAHTRVGAELRGDFAVEGGMRLMPYVGVYHLADHRRAVAKFNEEYLQVPKAGSRAAAQLGASLGFHPQSQLDFSVQTERGEGWRKPAAVTLGYRFLW